MAGGRLARAVGVVAAATLLSGCAVAAESLAGKPTWVPKPEGPPPADVPGPQLPGDPGGNGYPRGREAPGQPDDPGVVATGLRLPWGLAVLPNGSAIVGERTTGRIVQVQPVRAAVRPLMRIAGIDASGDGGLLDLALSPDYLDDGLVFAYVTTRTDNRVVRFELGGTVTPVLTGIPRGTVDNGGRLAFGADGMLYVGTGDTGRPALAADPRSLAGKVLRITRFGRPAPGNPSPASPVWTRGHRSVAGLCVGTGGQPYETEVAPAGDEINALHAAGDYGWAGPARPAATRPVVTLPAGTTGAGGCAVVQRGLFVAALRGKRLWALPLDDSGTPGRPRSLLAGAYGRIRTVVSAPDGALWLTTSNRDGAGEPVPQDDRVIRIVPPTSATNSPA
jgi:glucose/arabinose dehydrogenase